jgi:hypothetical protein
MFTAQLNFCCITAVDSPILIKMNAKNLNKTIIKQK